MRIVAFIASVGLAACTCPGMTVECIDGTEDTCDAGSLPEDFCNSPQEANDDATRCHLVVTSGGATPNRKQDVYISRLADGGVDRDWYVAQLPSLTPRSLLHVNGGYQAPQTAVNFSLNVVKADGTSSVVNGVDRHGASAPKPVDLILPFSESNAKLLVLVGDEGGAQPKVDNRNPYSLMVEVMENPDLNEPNDQTATPIAITAMGAASVGSSTGFLATDDDVDLFSFPMTLAGRRIIYLHLTEVGTHPTNPPPPYRLAYTLYDPSDVPIAEGVMDNEFLPIDLATAHLAPSMGSYKIKVSGYKMDGATTAVQGDLRVQYKVEVQLLPDLDMQEPNDTLANAKPVTISPNGSVTLVGKLAHVPDEEWFVVSLPSRSTPSTFRYRITAATTGGRFAPLSGTPGRQLRVTKRVTIGATSADRRAACIGNPVACPKAFDAELGLIQDICQSSDPAPCLWAQRNEELPRIAQLRNFVGALPVAANTPTEFLVMFRDEGKGNSKYADDRDWTMELEWRDDPDEASRGAGPTAVTLGPATTVSTGELTYGYGNYRDADWFMSTEGLRGLGDYDAIPTDKDVFEFGFGGAMGEQGWELSWTLQHSSDGGTKPPGELAFELTFCSTGAVPDGGLCAGAQNRIFAFNDQSLTPWYLPQSASNGRALFTRQNTGSATTYTVTPVGCSCFSAARTAPGSFFANVAAIHRLTNDPIRYQISQRVIPYPFSYTNDGGTGTCPVVDAGCGFAR
jgi:hypothetical protein